MLHIFTLTWNNLNKLEKLKSDLDDLNTKLNGEVRWHIRDNGSKDNTYETINKWQGVTAYNIGHNRDSFSQGVNFLFDHTMPEDDDLILLLNNDIRIANTDSILEMIRLMKPDVGVVGCRLLYPGTNKLQHAGVIFGVRYGSMPYHFRHKEQNDKNSEKNRYFQAVTAACCLIRSGDFKKVGGFDLGFKWAFDDIDFCLSLGALGKKIVYCGKTEIYHEESASLNKNPVNKMFLAQNVAYFKKKWWKNGKPIYTLDHEFYLKDPNYKCLL